jgi:hypothetical protein
MDRNDLLLDPCRLGVQSIVSKIIFEPMVHLAQTVHLYYIEIDGISIRTETRFHSTHVTLEYQWLRQNDL